MCGVCGVMYKHKGTDSPVPIGAHLVKMLASLIHRGSDSTGVTVVGESEDNELILRLWEDKQTDSDCSIDVQRTIEQLGGIIKSLDSADGYLRLKIGYSGDQAELAEALAQMKGIEIHSIGECSEVIKDVGDANTLERRHSISNLEGTHGIGHVRMATESQVDISHSHPFWAYPFPDVTVVHNGQLTNYHKLKRKYEDLTYIFQTENDSELIAVYLAEKLSRDASLEEALRDSLLDLDGTFTFLVCTKNSLGYAKDRWSAKPLVIMETDELVAIASEEVAMRGMFPMKIERVEPQENEVMTWSI